MARGSENRSVQWLPIAVAAACTTALALLLFTGVRLAARLQSASSALQLASGLTAQPQLLHSELTLIQRGLETQTYVGDSLRALAGSRAASNQSYTRLAVAMQGAGLAESAYRSADLVFSSAASPASSGCQCSRACAASAAASLRSASPAPCIATARRV